MTYLFGDSTLSNLEINYIAFLQDALDMSVSIINAEVRAQLAELQTEDLRRSAEDELRRLEALNQRVSAAIEAVSATVAGAEAGQTQQTANKIRQALALAVSEGASAVKGKLATDLKALELQATRERTSNEKSVEKFLLRQDFPDTVHRYEVHLRGASYETQMSGRGDGGIGWTMALSLPKGSVFQTPLKVEAVSPDLEIKLPEMSGAFKKSVKWKPVRLANKWIHALTIAPTEGHVQLRNTAEANNEDGIDLVFSQKGQKIQIKRVGKEGGETVEPEAEDRRPLLEMYDGLRVAALELGSHRKALLKVSLEQKSFSEHPDPAALCRRLVERMSPIVQEIARRSMSSDELVLKRDLGNHRREEIFASTRELKAKIAQVDADWRSMFDPLGFGDDDTAVKAIASIMTPIPARQTEPMGSVEVDVDEQGRQRPPSTRPPSERG